MEDILDARRLMLDAKPEEQSIFAPLADSRQAFLSILI